MDKDGVKLFICVCVFTCVQCFFTNLLWRSLKSIPIDVRQNQNNFPGHMDSPMMAELRKHSIKIRDGFWRSMKCDLIKDRTKSSRRRISHSTYLTAKELYCLY